MSAEERLHPVTNLRLYGLACLIGGLGILLVLLQALWMMSRQEASPTLVTIYICIPLVAPVIFALLPTRRSVDLSTRYEWHWPVVYLTLGLPAALTLLCLFLVAVNHDFDHIVGVPFFLGLIVGGDLGRLLRCLLLRCATKTA
jgi:hypothetical protein